MTYLLLVSIGISIAVAGIRGGKLARLGELPFRLWWALPLIALAQSLVIRLMYAPARLPLWHPRPLVMILSYLLLWLVVWQNRTLPGMRAVLLGVTLNLLAIAANGGYMPISAQALAGIGLGDAAYQVPPGSVIAGTKDALVSAQHAPFWMLGDVLVVPEPFPWPTALSVGDAILAAGVFWLVLQTMQTSPHPGDREWTQS